MYYTLESTICNNTLLLFCCHNRKKTHTHTGKNITHDDDTHHCVVWRGCIVRPCLSRASIHIFIRQLCCGLVALYVRGAANGGRTTTTTAVLCGRTNAADALPAQYCISRAINLYKIYSTSYIIIVSVQLCAAHAPFCLTIAKSAKEERTRDDNATLGIYSHRQTNIQYMPMYIFAQNQQSAVTQSKRKCVPCHPTT